MPTLDPKALAAEILAAYAHGRMMATPPSSRDPGFDLASAYAVEAELVRLQLSLAGGCAPRLEPEVVFKLRQPPAPGQGDAAAILASVEWLALGFEINDCLFPDWKFQPADFVAAFGLHTALVVGEPRPLDPTALPALADQLAKFKLQLLKNGAMVEEGAGKNSLRSPALCLGELATALARRPDAEPLATGELISSGTLTTPQPVSAGETWTAKVEGLDLPDLNLRLSAV